MLSIVLLVCLCLFIRPLHRIQINISSAPFALSCSSYRFFSAFYNKKVAATREFFTQLLTRALNHRLSFFRQSPQGWRALLNRWVGLHTYGQMGPFSHRVLFASLSLLPLPSILISVPTKKTNNTHHIGGNQGLSQYLKTLIVIYFPLFFYLLSALKIIYFTRKSVNYLTMDAWKVKYAKSQPSTRTCINASITVQYNSLPLLYILLGKWEIDPAID